MVTPTERQWAEEHSTNTPQRSEPTNTPRDDRAYHLARVCARFPRTISTQGAQRLARLLRPPPEQ
ncbi:MAG: hypothetical protein ACRDTD_19905 [Pseudonocardiaceae bacterium]